VNTSGTSKKIIHDRLGKDTPNCRDVEVKSSPNATLISKERLGGLQHRYSWRRIAIWKPTRRGQICSARRYESGALVSDKHGHAAV